jgi:hypothetical protein
MRLFTLRPVGMGCLVFNAGFLVTQSFRLIQEKEENPEILQNEVNALKEQLEQARNLVERYKSHESTKIQKLDADDQKRSDLDRIKEKLQQRLVELEPLPELLKTTELQLHESTQKLKDYEQRNVEQNKTIADLQTKINQQNAVMAAAGTSSQAVHQAADSKTKSTDEENHDLFRQLTLKDDALREINVGLLRQRRSLFFSLNNFLRPRTDWPSKRMRRRA